MAKIDVDSYFLYGLDLDNRRVFLAESDDSIKHVIKGLYFMEQENKQPIELYVASYGGDIFDMFALHDTIKAIKCPVHTIGLGSVMSAAVLTVACGTKQKRFAGPNTSFMVHLPWHDWGEKNIAEVATDVKYTKRIWDNWYELMAKYTNKPESHWKKLCSKQGDAFFTTQEALDWGVIDAIWDEK